MNQTSTPTIVLVHGALSDASIWTPVVSLLHLAGYNVIAPAMPLRGLHSDVAYLGSVLDTIDERVVLVGHSYAGAVISHMPRRIDQVIALVYVAAFQPTTGEAAGELNSRFPGSLLGEDTLLMRPTPDGTDLYLKPERFQDVYAGDVSYASAALMAVTQRPVDVRAMQETLQGEPAWKAIPSWALIASEDRSIPPATLRFMAARAGSKSVVVDASHAVPVSQSHVVVRLILEAASRKQHSSADLDT